MALAAQPKNLQIENVVLNLPRNIRCNKCRNTMAKDTEINSRKEKSSGNLEYLGIKNTRFHFNCTKCSAGIVLRTNPQLSRVLCESDATLFCGDQLPGRLPYGLEEESNWDENRDEILAQRIFMLRQKKHKRKMEEVGDAMKSLDLEREI
ncbi:coiled-coil domain-containing protein 94-like [Prunus avium]|uniref:Coiled-coil domain-containing protein 94-like n=1 Tax=Prunus avium TaxID=42229 RepID=A0A6P5SNT6_PRUAV|nr:coiled-coil domain-containing protein 94-like [Prunus avium]